MTLNDIAILIRDNGGLITIAVVITMSLVQISPIKINPWSWIGNALNKDVIAKLDNHGKEIDQLREDISAVRKDVGESSAIASRYRILRFDDEILHEVKHSRACEKISVN